MEEIYNDNVNEIESQKRPGLLTVLCVLTFIYSGLVILCSLMIPSFPDAIVDALKNSPTYDEVKMADTIRVIEAGWGYYISILLIALCSAIGAALMWKLKRLGFHIYAVSNLIWLFIPKLFLGLGTGIGGIILASGFIVLYAMNLKHMK